MVNTGEMQLGTVTVLIDGKPSVDEKVDALAVEAAQRVGVTPQAEEKFRTLFKYYMTRAVEVAQDKE